MLFAWCREAATKYSPGQRSAATAALGTRSPNRNRSPVGATEAAHPATSLAVQQRHNVAVVRKPAAKMHPQKDLALEGLRLLRVLLSPRQWGDEDYLVIRRDDWPFELKQPSRGGVAGSWCQCD
jgi:hypothetical protein